MVTVQFDGGVNSKLPWEFEPEAADHAGAPGRAVRGDVLRAQHQRPRHRRQRRAVGRAGARVGLLQQDRMLLLHRADAAGRRERATCRCASSSTRTCRPTSKTITLSYTFFKNDALTAQRVGTPPARARRAARRALTIHATSNRHGTPPWPKPTRHDANIYYVPHSSRWPFLGSIALFITMVGVASWLNEASWGKPVFFVGIALMCGVLFGWFGDVIRESLAGNYNKQVDTSFRMGMVWFIFSEVMFFAAFFGALFYARQFALPWLRRRRRRRDDQRAAVGRLQRRLADQRPGRDRRRTSRPSRPGACRCSTR